MKRPSRFPADFLSRLLFAAALFSTTAEIIANGHISHAILRLALWSALANLVPSFLPRKGFHFCLGLLWILSPLVLALLAYISMNGMAPQPVTAFAILQEADCADILSAIHTSLDSGSFKWIALAFIGLLTGATGLAIQTVFSQNRTSVALRNAILCLSLLPVVAGFWWQLLDSKAPYWLMTAEETHATVLGEISSIALSYIENPSLRINDDSMITHADAHESVKISVPHLSILVIGESMRADGFGPDKVNRGPSSKELGARVQANLAAWLPPACVGHDSTALSVPMLITGTTPDHQVEAKNAPTGLSRLQSAGYTVGWFASGTQIGFVGPEVTKGRGLYWDSFSGEAATYDEQLLPVTENFVNPLMDDGYQGQPKALVLHIMGSHFAYEDRYPADLFPSEPTGLSDEDLENLRYDRANENTAKFLSELAHMIDKVKVPAIAVYTSDHGENLLRDHNGLLRHVSPRSSLAAYMVPVFVMWNEAEQKTGAPEKILSSVLNGQRIAQIDIYHTWMSLSGLDGGETVKPTLDPLVYGAINLGDKFTAVPCSSLKP